MSAFRILVTGSREWDDGEAITFELAGLALLHRELVIVHGACPTGADHLADMAADHLGLPQERHPADWTGYGKSAGFIRNAEMVALGADVCLAFYKQGAGNEGTDHCASLAEKAGHPGQAVHVMTTLHSLATDEGTDQDAATRRAAA